MTLTEFLLARIAEDEEVAQATPRALTFRVASETVATSDAITAHALRWEPIRVLAECEAKRRIIEEMRSCLLTEQEKVTRRTLYSYETDMAFDEFAANTLRNLAAVYADHPDFDPAWRI